MKHIRQENVDTVTATIH